ncbi:hypothetical protein R1sor_024987 [Riccia sorocarpa]|uniref:Histone-lysine N-methyltransferase, H3 lysine-79 specific n=1 Tax=Riccia sorocarpa TaxID=122646 RepID=A0ABD3GB66_9MARC
MQQQEEESKQELEDLLGPEVLEDCNLQDEMSGAGFSGGSTSYPPAVELEETETTSDSEDVLENRQKLLAEIRSCFRVLSIHSRLRGTESPRTRRMIMQANERQSLHSLAMEKSAEFDSAGSSKGMSSPHPVQGCLLYNQLMTGPPILLAGGPSHQGVNFQSARHEISEPTSESIHQSPLVNPTLQLETKEDLSKSDVMKVVEWLYRDHPGAVWRVSFVAFAKLMETFRPKRDSSSSAVVSDIAGEKIGFNFYDLGCGGGRCVFMASLLNTSCVKACGIEIVPGMHEMNQTLLRLYGMEVHPNLHPLKQAQQLQFLPGDFLEMDWSDGDVIFTNATCFEDPLFHRFEEMALKILKPGTIVISVARCFSNQERWELLDAQERRMSWAPAMVYVYRKKEDSVD